MRMALWVMAGCDIDPTWKLTKSLRMDLILGCVRLSRGSNMSANRRDDMKGLRPRIGQRIVVFLAWLAAIGMILVVVRVLTFVV